ncbi:MAG: hypothetical protein IPH18_15765 [Chitinophagaceae bacterium]|nr:hypothetical protein [Chitinophagaceae bacterium]
MTLQVRNKKLALFFSSSACQPRLTATWKMWPYRWYMQVSGKNTKKKKDRKQKLVLEMVNLTDQPSQTRGK